MVKRYLDVDYLLIALGVTGIILSAFADFIGLGRPGFGLQQMASMGVGAFIAAVGFLRALEHQIPYMTDLTIGII